MAISGLQEINIGLPNESVGSDSLYTAFNKTKDNFAVLANTGSPYNTFTAGNGVSITQDSANGIVTINNTGVFSITPADGSIVVNQSNGAVTISAVGGGGNGSGTVTSVGLIPASTSRLSVTGVAGNTIISSGTFTIDLATSGVTAGSYTYPSVTVDTYGRVTSISNGASVGTVTSVGVTPGTGIQVSGSPITTSGNITITNTGVTRLSAGTGISLSGSNGNVTVSATSLGGTVTSVGITSTTLDISGSPITTTGSIVVDLPSNISVSGNITGGNLRTTGQVLYNGGQNLADGGAASLTTTASYFTTTTASTATLAAGTAGQIKTFMMVADGGDMVITVTNAGWKSSGTGTITFNDIGDGCTLQYMNSKWYCVGNNGAVFA